MQPVEIMPSALPFRAYINSPVKTFPTSTPTCLARLTSIHQSEEAFILNINAKLSGSQAEVFCPSGKTLQKMAEQCSSEKANAGNITFAMQMTSKGHLLSVGAQLALGAVSQPSTHYTANHFSMESNRISKESHLHVGTDIQGKGGGFFNWISSRLPTLADPFVFPMAVALPSDDALTEHRAPRSATIDLNAEPYRAYRVQLLRNLDPEGAKAISDEAIKEAIAGKALYLTVSREQSAQRGKRASMQLMNQIQKAEDEKYTRMYCKIRTKTVDGTVVGDTLLISSEYLRNPFRALADVINKNMAPKETMGENEVLFFEIFNMVFDGGVTFFIGPTYPIVKYGTVKLLSVSGDAINGDMTCLKREFTGEALAELLFNTEIGITEHMMLEPELPSVAVETAISEEFTPSGFFIHEDTATGIHTEKIIVAEQDGNTFLIKEKVPGVFVMHDSHVAGSGNTEKKISVDFEKHRIFFEDASAEHPGIAFSVVNGKKYIHLDGKKRELQYNLQPACFKVKMPSTAGEQWLPVYRDAYSGKWHLGVDNGTPLFSEAERNVIDRLAITINHDEEVIALSALNNHYFHDGKILEIRNKNADVSTAQVIDNVIEINGKLVPVSLSVVPGHGVNYFIGGKYALAVNKGRWVFESATSAALTGELKHKITPSMYVKDVDEAKLSTADDNGLKWSKEGKSYLKFQNNFIEILHLNKDRYLLRSDSGLSTLDVFLKDKMFFPRETYTRTQQIETVDVAGSRQQHENENQPGPSQRLTTWEQQRQSLNVNQATLPVLPHAPQIGEDALSVLSPKQKAAIKGFVQQYQHKLTPFVIVDYAESMHIDINLLLNELSSYDVNTNDFMATIEEVKRRAKSYAKRREQLKNEVSMQQSKKSNAANDLPPIISKTNTQQPASGYETNKPFVSHIIPASAISSETDPQLLSAFSAFADLEKQIEQNSNVIFYMQSHNINFPRLVEQLASRNIDATLLIAKLKGIYFDFFKEKVLPKGLKNRNNYELGVFNWQAQHAENPKSSYEEFCHYHNLHPGTLSKYVSKNGYISIYGYDRVIFRAHYPFSVVKAKDVKAWEKVAREFHSRIQATNRPSIFNMAGEDIREKAYQAFIIKRNLNANVFRGYINKKGFLTVRGSRFVKNARLSLKARHTVATLGGSARIANEHQPVRVIHARNENDATHLEFDHAHSPRKDITAVDQFIQERTIDDNLPILRDLNDMNKSLLIQEEGDIDKIIVSEWGWGKLNDEFSKMTRKNVESERIAILEDIKQWLRDEGHHAERFTLLFDVKKTKEVEGIDRGLGVYAKDDIPKFTVLGPYAGVLHKSEVSFGQEARRQGQGAVLSYLWNNLDGTSTISGLQHGNSLSLINTRKMTTYPMLPTPNNVVVVYAGKNLVFYVTRVKVKKGTELLVDYGSAYDPHQQMIKTESEINSFAGDEAMS